MRIQTLRNGTKLHIHPKPEFISDIICTTQDYFERGTLEIIKNMFDCSYVLDIGANIGNHSKYFACECRSKVYAFEPMSKNFEILRQNLPDEHLFKLAIGDKAAKVNLYTYSSSMGNNTLSNLCDQAPDWGTGLGIEEVIVMPLDYFSFPNITFIKIDVEGSELRVLKGAIQTLAIHRPGICIEYGGDDGLEKAGIEYRSKDISDLLSELNYAYLGNDGGGNNFYIADKINCTIFT